MTMAAAGGPRLPLLLMLLLLTVAQAQAIRDGRALRRGGGREKQAATGAQTPSMPPLQLRACYEAEGHQAFPFPRSLFPSCQVLAAGQAVLYWNATEAIAALPPTSSENNSSPARLPVADAQVTLGLLLKGDGVGRPGSWMALGVTPESKGMRGLDVAMLRWLPQQHHQQQLPPAGAFIFDDRFSYDYKPPTVDAQDKGDKALLFAQAWPGHGAAAFAFSMRASNCHDPEEDAPLLAGRDMFVLWAHGELEKGGQELAKHGPGSKGATRVPLLAPPPEPAAITSDDPTTAVKEDAADSPAVPAPARRLTLALPEVTLPASAADPLRYYCVFVETPQDAKHHIYGMRLLAGEELAEAYIHHAGLYAAGDAPPARKPGEVFECSATPDFGLPIAINDRGEWTTPSPKAYAEVDAAVAFGKGYDKYWLLEVHFVYAGEDAQEKQEGTPTAKGVGIEVAYSPTLRSQDVGLLVLGAPATVPTLDFNSSLVIPPGNPAFHYLNYCPGSCTQKYLSAEGARILHAHAHIHTLATGAEIQLLRPLPAGDKKKLARRRLLYRKYWDFNNPTGVTFQQPGPRLLPGDGFLTRCTYDSSSRTTPTNYGPSTEDEMCLTMVFYYPAVQPSVLCFDYEGASSPGLNYLRSVGKLQALGQCQLGQSFANMTGHPALRDQIVFKDGIMVPLDPEQMAEAKEGFADPALEMCRPTP